VYVCVFFLIYFSIRSISKCCRCVKATRSHLYTYTFFFLFIVDKTYTRIKITQAYNSNHLIDYLVLLFLCIVCIWIGFQFCSFSLTVRLFVFIEHMYIYTKIDDYRFYLFMKTNHQKITSYAIDQHPKKKKKK
jgi:hypothetical protein